MKTLKEIDHPKLKNKINHILVIDDDEFLLNAVRKKLELANYKVTVSNNVHDAHFKLSILEPDLILLDIIMPDINGIEFMYQISSETTISHPPIVFMSYLSKKKLSEMGYSLGSAHYIPKPFDINKLPLLLNKAISSRPSQGH